MRVARRSLSDRPRSATASGAPSGIRPLMPPLGIIPRRSCHYPKQEGNQVGDHRLLRDPDRLGEGDLDAFATRRPKDGFSFDEGSCSSASSDPGRDHAGLVRALRRGAAARRPSRVAQGDRLGARALARPVPARQRRQLAALPGGERGHGPAGQASYEIGIVSNIDDKLLGLSRRHLRTELDLVVTAQQVRSYKPDPAHFKECGAANRRQEGLAAHRRAATTTDVAPLLKMNVPVIWVNRHGEKLDGRKPPTATVKNLREAAKLLGAGSELVADIRRSRRRGDGRAAPASASRPSEAARPRGAPARASASQPGRDRRAEVRDDQPPSLPEPASRGRDVAAQGAQLLRRRAQLAAGRRLVREPLQRPRPGARRELSRTTRTGPASRASPSACARDAPRRAPRSTWCATRSTACSPTTSTTSAGATTTGRSRRRFADPDSAYVTRSRYFFQLEPYLERVRSGADRDRRPRGAEGATAPARCAACSPSSASTRLHLGAVRARVGDRHGQGAAGRFRLMDRAVRLPGLRALDRNFDRLPESLRWLVERVVHDPEGGAAAQAGLPAGDQRALAERFRPDVERLEDWPAAASAGGSRVPEDNVELCGGVRGARARGVAGAPAAARSRVRADHAARPRDGARHLPRGRPGCGATSSRSRTPWRTSASCPRESSSTAGDKVVVRVPARRRAVRRPASRPSSARCRSGPCGRARRLRAEVFASREEALRGGRAADGHLGCGHANRGSGRRADRHRRRGRRGAAPPRPRADPARGAFATPSATTGPGRARRRRATSPRAAPSRRSCAAGPAPAPRSRPTRWPGSAPRSAATRRRPPARAGGTTPTCSRSACAPPPRPSWPRSSTPGSRRRPSSEDDDRANVEHLGEIESAG